MSRLTTGEFHMIVLGGHTQAPRVQARGAPVEFVVPEDAAIIGFLHLGVPRTAAHPNLAKLFVNLVLSEEGQRISYEFEYSDHPALPGSQSARIVNDLMAKGVKPLQFDVQYVADHPEIRDLAEELARILREKQGT
jgi:ABC-type Fe3+ transport system substrate-binding protein